jgi:hypothetical protein
MFNLSHLDGGLMMRQHQAHEVFTNIAGRLHHMRLLMHLIHRLKKLIATARLYLTFRLGVGYSIQGVDNLRTKLPVLH